jgi:hypothetical protein
MRRTDLLQRRNPEEASREFERHYHRYGPTGVICDTEGRGYATPKNRSLRELVINSPKGRKILLWAPDTTLYWRFQERSLLSFEDPKAIKTEIRELLADALLAWGDALPIKFSQQDDEDDEWDFEIAVEEADKCNPEGCVMAQAFFPMAGRRRMRFYPRMFTLSWEEKVRIVLHEAGHTLGLRHFFAQDDVREAAFPSVKFGTHSPFTIMNYGSKSVLTDDDKADLKRLYQMAWSGELTEINGTPIKFVRPFHTTGVSVEDLVAGGDRIRTR